MAILLICFLLAHGTSDAINAQAPAAVVQPGAPGKPSKTLPEGTRAAATTVSAADVDFMQGMIMHHQQAVEMTALISEHTKDKTINDLGKRITLSQSDEIKFMRHWLEARGEATSMKMGVGPEANIMSMPMMSAPIMPGMLTSQQMEALRRAHGKEFDHLFLTGMIQHHRGALVMVKNLFDSAGAGQDAELFDFATDVDNTQRAEIRLMENILKENK